MSDKHQVQGNESDVAIAKAKDFWTRNSKVILGVGSLLVVAVAGYYIYSHFFKGPKEEKAADALYKAEEYFRMDSLQLGLNGDGQNLGFIRIIDRYSGTAAANLAHYYAGASYVRLDDNAKAIEHLKKFSTDAKQIQQRAYKLLGDAYADQGKSKEALDYYKKAARHFESDKEASSEALSLAGYLAMKVLNDQKEAISLFKELKEKFPGGPRAGDADKYLAQLGVYNAN